MSEKESGSVDHVADLIHLPKSRKTKSLREQISEDIATSFAGHFREQNELVRSANSDLASQVQRLMAGIDRLLGEMNGVRTGEKDEAFARVGSANETVDLPTVAAESALFYTYTASEIGDELGG